MKKKLLLLLLVFLGGVSSASAWGDMYLICNENNGWDVDTYDDHFKFVKVDDTHYRATVPGSYINSNKWNFRFREKNGDWYNIGPIGSTESDNQEVTSTAVSTNYKNSNNASFYIAKNVSASFVQIFIQWADPYWKVTAEVITDTYTIGFINPDKWSSVKAYAYYNVDNCPTQYPLGVWSSRSTMTESSNIYTISVPAVSGGNVVFTDNGTNKYPTTDGFDIAENAVYTSTGQVTSVNASVSASDYATFSSAYPLTIPADGDITAYRADRIENGEVIFKKVSGNIPASTGLLLKSSGEANATLDVVISGDAVGDNMMVATTSGTVVSASTSGSYNYFLADGTNGIGFYNLASAATSGAGKAYLHTTEALGTASARVAWVFEDDETTGISVVKDNANTEVVYNLNGQRVNNVTRGLYIVNGKKVIKK